MGFCGGFGVKMRENWGPEVVFVVKMRRIGVLWRFWGKNEGKWGPVVGLG